MREVTIHEAKTHLSALIRAVESGEAILLKRGDVPVAQLVPVPKKSQKRALGQWAGKIAIAPDFDAPLPKLEEFFE